MLASGRITESPVFKFYFFSTGNFYRKNSRKNFRDIRFYKMCEEHRLPADYLQIVSQAGSFVRGHR